MGKHRPTAAIVVALFGAVAVAVTLMRKRRRRGADAVAREQSGSVTQNVTSPPSNEMVVRRREPGSIPVGPDYGTGGSGSPPDLRSLRTYYLLASDSILSEGGGVAANRRRMLARLRRYADLGPEQPSLTDLVVFSHGWHRLFLDALAAYDRIVGRLTHLGVRGLVGGRQHRPFYPLYLTVHWKSDPGGDELRNRTGERERAAFVRRALEVFHDVPESNGFESTRETLHRFYEFLRTFYASGVEAFDEGTPLHREAVDLFHHLWKLHPRIQPALDEPERLALLLWAYLEAARPSKSRRLLRTFRRGVRTVAAPVAAVAVIAGATTGLLRAVPRRAGSAGTSAGRGGKGVAAGSVALALAGGAVADALVKRRKTGIAPDGAARAGFAPSAPPGDAPASWERPAAVTQVALSAVTVLGAFPLLLWCAGTAGWAAASKRVRGFRRRNGDGGRERPEHTERATRVTRATARAAGWVLKPIRTWTGSAGNVSLDGTLPGGLEQQLAFWEMQQKAASTGEELGAFLADLLDELEPSGPVRIHLVGHSFGGALVAHAARRLIELRPDAPLHTLGLVLPALRADWFCDQEKLVSSVRSTLFCVFSSRDTANGWYFPLANAGQASAGRIGLVDVPAADVPVTTVTLTRDMLRAPFPNLEAPAGRRLIRNIDASDVARRGPLALGGGHGDVFTDDMTLLLFAYTIGAGYHLDGTMQRKAADSV